MVDEAGFMETEAPVYVRFGQWCEGGRVAAVRRTEDYYNIDDIRIFVRMLEREGLPEGVSKSLSAIENIVEAGGLMEIQFRGLEKEYENLILLF